jgi:hypothetical protein
LPLVLIFFAFLTEETEMKNLMVAIATVVSGALMSGCTGIPYNPATNNDITPPIISIRVSGDSPSSTWDAQHSKFDPAIPLTPLEVGARVSSNMQNVQVHKNGEASVVATARDDESGIRSLKLTCQRTVYYNWDSASQTENNTLLLPVFSEQTNHVNNGYVPASGIEQQVLNMSGQMVFRNSQGTPTRGHRVSITCSAEASNFNSISIQSQGVVIWGGEHANLP